MDRANAAAVPAPRLADGGAVRGVIHRVSVAEVGGGSLAAAWKGGHPLALVLVGTGVAALFGTVFVLYGYARALRKADQNNELETACRGLWQFVVETLGVDMTKVGVHVWTVKGFVGCRYLDKRASFILQNRRSTPVLWRKGKGAIGIAWDEDDPVAGLRRSRRV